jgi:hypothetical protein
LLKICFCDALTHFFTQNNGLPGSRVGCALRMSSLNIDPVF